MFTIHGLPSPRIRKYSVLKFDQSKCFFLSNEDCKNTVTLTSQSSITFCSVDYISLRSYLKTKPKAIVKRNSGLRSTNPRLFGAQSAVSAVACLSIPWWSRAQRAIQHASGIIPSQFYIGLTAATDLPVRGDHPLTD